MWHSVAAARATVNLNRDRSLSPTAPTWQWPAESAPRFARVSASATWALTRRFNLSASASELNTRAISLSHDATVVPGPAGATVSAAVAN